MYGGSPGNEFQKDEAADDIVDDPTGEKGVENELAENGDEPLSPDDNDEEVDEADDADAEPMAACFWTSGVAFAESGDELVDGENEFC